ncbi:Signal transduction histidine kinase [Oscillospiraceae bacterium]|nr:Signal transduction histidine kinase [Oscillospiraceae bacterium]
MNWRLADKTILLISTVLITVLSLSGAVVGADVASILLALIIFAITEIRSERIWAYVIAAALLISVFFYPRLIVAVPMATYGVVSSSSGKSSLKIAAAALLTGSVFFFERNHITAFAIAVISAIGVYMAFKSVRFEVTEKILTDKYDEARIASSNARRLGEEIMKNADNEIYVARLKERNRIAREIHDNVGHMITRVIVQLQAVKIINKDPVVGAQLESVGETLDLAMTGIRKSVHELHDDSIDLSIGINDITKTISEKFEVEVKTSIESPADNKTKSAVLGIIKEAVTNISKYSSGDKVLIEVTENNTFWRIKVFDNGSNPVREFDLSDDSLSEGTGIGLKNIGARASGAGGRASVLSDEKGFTILATLPKGKE